MLPTRLVACVVVYPLPGISVLLRIVRDLSQSPYDVYTQSLLYAYLLNCMNHLNFPGSVPEKGLPFVYFKGTVLFLCPEGAEHSDVLGVQ